MTMKAACSILCCSALLIFFVSTKGIAQLTVNEFLRSAHEDLSLKVIDDQSTFLQQKSYGMNAINRMQFRMQNNEGLLKETQRFGLWVSPENPWAISNNNKYFKTYGESLVHERSLALKQALAERYALIIDFLYLSEIRILKQSEKELIDAQVSIMENQQSSDFFNPDNFAELKLKQIEKAVEIEEALFVVDNQIALIDTKYTGAFIKQLNWKSDNVISLDQIKSIADSIGSSEIKSPQEKYDESKIELAKYSYKIQKSNVNTGFIQGNYLQGNIAKDKTPWSVVAGVTIPIFNPNKGDMARKQLNVIEAENKKSVNSIKVTMERAMVVSKLKNLLDRYSNMDAKIKALDLNVVGNTLSSMNNNNPAVRIRLNAGSLKLRSILLSLRQNILTTYIELLDAYDLLQQRPLINYLSSDLSKIE
jgi:hypothetical protein